VVKRNGLQEDNDRVECFADEKRRVLELGHMNLIPPNVGIFDEPTRCYRINKQWASIVMGMVSWLAETAVWQAANNEGYDAIQQILSFMVGENCMSFELRQSPTNSCHLEQSTDGGLSWSLVFDYSLCVPPSITALVNSVNNINNNTQQIWNTAYNAPDNSVTYNTTTINNFTGTPALDAPLGDFVGDDCNGDTSRDQIYGGVSRLVDYILQKNTDFLQRLGQTVANPADIASWIVSAVPGLGDLPFDEGARWIGFLTDELLGEYEATLDDDLIQTIKCDLFCIAVSHGCALTLSDCLDYFSSHLPSGVDFYARTIQQVIQFTLSGTMAGNDYVYFTCVFQLMMVLTDQSLFTVTSSEAYELQYLAGTYSPAHDWFLFCTECPEYFRHYAWDFADGAGIWTIVNGTLAASGIAGIEDHDGIRVVTLEYVFPTAVTIVGAITTHTRQGTRLTGSFDVSAVRGYANADFTNEIFFTGAGGEGDGEIIICNQPIPQIISSIRVSCGVDGTDFPDNFIIQNKIELFFSADASYLFGKIEPVFNICT
jgi:hypothetical protein